MLRANCERSKAGRIGARGVRIFTGGVEVRMDGGVGAVAGANAGPGASAAPPPPPPPNAGGFEAAMQAPRGTAPPQPPEQFQPGPATGQTIARYDGHDLRADARSNQVFGSQEAAT